MSAVSVAIYYVFTDQLNTPREVTRPADNELMWSWFSDPFGTDAANSNPAGAGTFAYNLRLPGQVFDGQVGLHYNYFRDYDPGTGKYLQSDPIGVYGGVNTYAYARGNPIRWIDSWGWKPGDPFQTPQSAAVDALNWVYQTYSFPNALPNFVLPMPEYAGTIYHGPDGYYATNPNPGDPYTGAEADPSYPPGGSSAVVALYHTHGQCAHGMNGGNDVFSSGIPGDKMGPDFRGVPSFLETPGWMILRYDPDPNLHQNGTVTEIQPGSFCPCD